MYTDPGPLLVVGTFPQIWCDKKPKGLKDIKDVTFYTADEGKVFTKDGKLFDSVVIRDGVNIEDYIEIVDPRKKEEEDGKQENKND